MTSASIVFWEGGDQNGWNAPRRTCDISLVVLELASIPDLSAPRFKHLGESIAERRGAVIKLQTQMLAQLHSLGNGNHVGIALRFRKQGAALRVFAVVRHVQSGQALPTPAEAAKTILQMMPAEYRMRHVPESDPAWRLATDLSWATQITEILKMESTVAAHDMEHYIAPLWVPKGEHDMNAVARALLAFQGDAMIDCTLIPADFHPQERDWVSKRAAELRQYERGMTIPLTNGRSHRLDAAPQLGLPAKNYEDMLTRYSRERLFLHSIRVLAAGNPFNITQAVITGAFANQANEISVVRGNALFDKQLAASNAVDIAPEVRWERWSKPIDQPYRVQRLHRLADVNELVGLWRLPIADKGDFPGLAVDSTGLAAPSVTRTGTYQIRLGVFPGEPARPGESATFNREDLSRHGLIVGVPGSGKTTLTMSILHQLWADPPAGEKIPFIVLEPAKTEYRALKSVAGLTDDLLVFTLGDERISPFRFNPFAIPNGISLESHISRLNACFTGAFNLFDPLPLLLDRAIRETYAEKGWLDESVGGDPGVQTPQLSDLIVQSEKVLKSSGYSDRLRDDIQAALLQRLESLRRGSKGRMLDTRESLPPEFLMNRPVVLELDALNGDEKALLMMFILTYVYEHARATRKSGSPLRHVMVVEEAHNLIGRGSQGGSDNRANPREQAIQLFIRMLAEMRALGEGILIADQLPTALAPEAVKQTNLKVLMRLTALDDREEIGNTMDLDAEHMKAVAHFRSGQAYAYLDRWDRVQLLDTDNFKSQYSVEEPQDESILASEMKSFEDALPSLYMPFPECSLGCNTCNRRVRSLVERGLVAGKMGIPPTSLTACQWLAAKTQEVRAQAESRYAENSPVFEFCAFLHAMHEQQQVFSMCRRRDSNCTCKMPDGLQQRLRTLAQSGKV